MFQFIEGCGSVRVKNSVLLQLNCLSIEVDGLLVVTMEECVIPLILQEIIATLLLNAALPLASRDR